MLNLLHLQMLLSVRIIHILCMICVRTTEAEPQAPIISAPPKLQPRYIEPRPSCLVFVHISSARLSSIYSARPTSIHKCTCYLSTYIHTSSNPHFQPHPLKCEMKTRGSFISYPQTPCQISPHTLYASQPPKSKHCLYISM